VAETDYVLTISERIALRWRRGACPRGPGGPVKLRPYALSLVWHPRVDADAGHRFLRDVFVRASREVAASVTSRPRTRLDATDPTSGQTRKRPIAGRAADNSCTVATASSEFCCVACTALAAR
jgi:hypothetical protein